MSNAPTAATPRGWYRWLFRIAGAYLALTVLVVIALLASITDANAGYPALFFGGLWLLIAWPVCTACAVLAALSLTRGEPHRAWVLAVGVVSCLIAWGLTGSTFAVIRRLLEAWVR